MKIETLSYSSGDVTFQGYLADPEGSGRRPGILIAHEAPGLNDHPKLRAREDLTAPRLAELAALDDAGFRAMFIGSPIKRIGRDRFVRNVLMAIGNSGEASLLPVARRLRSDPNPVVAEAAAWACERLGAPG